MFFSIIFTLFLVQANLYFVQSAQVFDVHKFGAIGDGVHKNTEAISKAIAAAHDAPGGGTVNFPKGTYLTGPIVFKSNVHLHLEDGVVIKFSDNFDDYLPMVQVRFEGTVLMNFSPLIYAYNASNFGIIGKGTLDGSSHKWIALADHYEKLHTDHLPIDQSSKYQQEFVRLNGDLFAKYKGLTDSKWIYDIHFLKPSFFQPMHSQYITLEGVTFVNSPFWTVTPTFSDHIRIHEVKVKNPHHHNSDGINPDSCRNVTISSCYVDVGDDCIAIKSGKDGQAREINRPTENVTITDFVCNGGFAAIAIGSDMSGSVRNVFIRNVTASNVKNGVHIKSCRGRGGVIENVHITDMTVHNKSIDYAIEIYPYYSWGCMKHLEAKVNDLTPTFRNIFITNFTATSKLGLAVAGLPEKHFTNIQLRNVHLVAEHEVVFTDVDELVLSNFTYTRDPPVKFPF